jgi:hypothetical protein
VRTATIRQVTNGYVIEQETTVEMLYQSTIGSYSKVTNVFGSLDDALISVAKFMAPDAKNVIVNVKA